MPQRKITKIKNHIYTHKRFYTGVTAITLAAIADVTLSTLNINKYSSGIEWNPLLRESIDYLGLHVGLVGTKGLGTLALIGIAKKHYDRHENLIGDIILYGATTTWSLAALSNLAAITY